VKTLRVEVTETVAARLAFLARRRKTKRSVIAREASALYLSSQEPTSRDSFLGLARDLVGCVSGPTDLSVGKKHRKGYGR
jgi:predicted transcriptional regulator